MSETPATLPWEVSRTCDGRVVAVPLAADFLLPVRVLLRVLQTQFVTNLEGLADRPDDPHGLTLGGGKKQNHSCDTQETICTTLFLPIGLEQSSLCSNFQPKIKDLIPYFVISCFFFFSKV